MIPKMDTGFRKKSCATTKRVRHDLDGLHLCCGAARRRTGFHCARGLVVHLHAFHRRSAGFRDPASHGRRYRLVSAARGSLLHPRRQPDELGRYHQPHLRFRRRARGLDARRARAREHHRFGDLRRDVRHRDRGCRRSRHHRDQGDEGPRLLDRVFRRRDRRIIDARADHPAVLAVRDLRDDGERLDRRAVSRRRHPRRRDDDVHDALRLLLRAQIQHGPRPGVPVEGAGADFHRRVAGVADARDHHRRHDVRLVHADGSRDRGLRLGHDPRDLPLSHPVAEAVLQGHDGHDRDHGRRPADRRRRLAVRLGADHDARHRVHHRGAALDHGQPLRHPVAGESRAARGRLFP